MSYGDDGEKRKRYAVIGISSVLLVAMVIAVTVGVSLNNGQSSPASSNKDGSHEVSASMKAIKSICQPTDYKEECINSLSSESGNTTDPKKLIQAGFKVAMKYLSEAAKKSVVLQDLEKDPRASKALGHCKQLMENSIDDLKHSVDKLGEFDISKFDQMLMDLKIWLSATVTYQETCLDGFQNTTGEAAEKMKKALKTSMRLSSNGLTMVSEISSVFSDLQLSSMGRRLFSDEEESELPVLGHSDEAEWFGGGVRRLMAVHPTKVKPNIVVAKDGSGKYTTINEALKDIPRRSENTFVIYIKEGVYKEYVTIERNMTNLLIIGDGANKTRITGDKNFIDGFPTSLTATVVVLGDHFRARDIGFENTAGAHKHQAVALRVNADEAIFYRCAMDGYQDTLYTHAKRQFYRDCNVSGTIDFVFGDAAAVFQNCRFIVRRPMDNQQCIVTAQGRKERRQPSAIIIQNGTFVADPDYYPVRFELPAYLGRPWKEFSRTIIMESFIDDLIQPRGWLPWAGDFGLRTCFYTEFGNRGPGAVEPSRRAKWKGVKNITAKHARDFTPGSFFKGDWWIKRTGIPYVSGMFSVVEKKD
ncbi:Putative pectinesterase/pectinesterase inhibitor 28 [Morus notabilis]|uniref:Pectinesterase n=1 Tax=Morus notabilis TaxID=981085 RepID=W9S2R1_9ROSA|nr:putative pectinesterase/pectinesterase inhibitor 28 [Morus notabilis]XP_010105652.1 putative pectinesterase/pectinesterase inhibitor 28 [Morus notabilis]EXB56090.1 Putative pectinesterase/pectinesterase inhibitor 28 [Morus notabilis]EXC05633.1 Putative pectinesterase/pectinesterase inhibitor 28 [Morus notabilis]